MQCQLPLIRQILRPARSLQRHLREAVGTKAIEPNTRCNGNRSSDTRSRADGIPPPSAPRQERSTLPNNGACDAQSDWHRQVFCPLFVRQRVRVPAMELVVIPDVAAVQFFATHTWGSVDIALVLSQREEITLAQAYSSRPIQGQTAAAGVPSRRMGCICKQSRRGRREYGGHGLIKDGLSQLSEPPAWSRPDAYWARHSRHREDRLSELIDTPKRQIAAFEAHVTSHVYRDICPMLAVIRLVQKGHYFQDSDIDSFAEPIADRIAHIERVIALLRTYDHYELALVDERPRRGDSCSDQSLLGSHRRDAGLYKRACAKSPWTYSAYRAIHRRANYRQRISGLLQRPVGTYCAT